MQVSSRGKGVWQRCEGVRTKDACRLDALEDPVNHLLARDGQQSLALAVTAAMGANASGARVLFVGRQLIGGFDEGKEVDAVAAGDDSAELGLGQLLWQERVGEHRHADECARCFEGGEEELEGVRGEMKTSTREESRDDAALQGRSGSAQLSQLQ